MRFIPTRVHGVLDYSVGVVLIFSPWLFGYARGGAETWFPAVLGAGAIAYSLVTDYELGVVRLMGMRTHLTLDGVSGVAMFASPWLLGFSEHVWLPHMVFGLVAIGAALFTHTTPAPNPGRLLRAAQG